MVHLLAARSLLHCAVRALWSVALCCFAIGLFLPAPSNGQPAPLPPSLLNHNIMPPSPDAAALGRFGEVPVSLYTGVPSIDIPLCAIAGRSLSVALSLQYHGGGVRPDQIAPWTGMNWTLNAGGAITRTCRGADDFMGRGYARNAALLLDNITFDCRNFVNAADATDYYEYVKDALAGDVDTQPDLFSFNFQGYSGKIIFDKLGNPHVSPSQPIRVQSPLTTGGNYWILTAPDGTAYRFATPETSASGNARSGSSAWYLSSITSPQQERVDFYYGDYTTTIYYINPHTTGAAVSTQTVFQGNMVCNSCPRSLNLGDRPASWVQGKYLRRIVSATHRIDLLSTNNRQDQPGMRQLNMVRIKSLADSSRYQEFRLRYGYYSGRLFLQEVQKAGLEVGQPEVLEPPYVFTYQPLFAEAVVGRGTYDVDRWGYYNAAGNIFPFPRFRTQTFQILTGANRNTDATAVTFGTLRRVQYPTGGYSAFEFESNDFSNIGGPLYNYAALAQTVCAQTDELGGPAAGEDCQPNTPRELPFTLSYEQPVQTVFTAEELGTGGGPVGQTEVSAAIYDVNNATVPVYTLDYHGNGPLSTHTTTSLAAGNYRLVVQVNTYRALRATVQLNYQDRQQVAKKVLGGGTRIKRIVTYDGTDHTKDQIKEYYYDNEAHTRSTGRLIHQPVFHTRTKEILLLSGGDGDESCTFTTTPEDSPGQYTCNYLVHFAEDIAAASGTAQGSAVGYDTVTVIQRGPASVIRSSSVFTNQAVGTVDLDDQYVEHQGFVPINNDERNGQLLQTLDYEVRPGGDPFRPADYRLLRRVTNQYGNDSLPLLEIPGVVIGGSLGQLLQIHALPCRGVVTQTYRTQVGWWPLTQTSETLYDAAGRARTITTQVVYDNREHLQPTRRITILPDGQRQIVRYKYPLDYATATDAGIAQLQQWHFVSVPIEEQNWVQLASGALRWLGGKVTRFTPNSTWGPSPTHIYTAAVSTPQIRPATETATAGRFTSLLPDPTYELRAEMSHLRGQLVGQALYRDRPAAYVWGYSFSKPIAEVQNATASQVAYTSFEPDSPGGWTYAAAPGQGREAGAARTGRWAYRLGGTGVSYTLPTQDTPAQYELLAWVQGGIPTVLDNQVAVGTAPQVQCVAPGGWQLVRWRLAGTAGHTVALAANGAVLVDELRLYPVGAQMTSLTYDALGGISSKTDPSGRTTLYEYDALGRLLRVRDEQGRILTEQEYKYARQL